MKNTLKLEEAAQFALGIIVFAQLPFAWWVFVALILTPDISMVGYLVNNKTGAIMYNLFHHKGIALLIVGLGYYFHNDITLLIGVILFSHSAMDRLMGYGLKYETGFKHTHLGDIGK